MLVDTAAWYALADSSDRHHDQARAFYAQRAGVTPLLTTDLIVAETMALLSAHLGRVAAQTFWSGLRETRTPVMVPEPVDLEVAWRIAQAYPDQTFSFVDCLSFSLMERLGIEEVFTFDAHFLVHRFGPGRRRGFRRLPG
jgi:predicted nucleic acid-binding protein